MNSRKNSAIVAVIISVLLIIAGVVQTAYFHRLKQNATEQVSGEITDVSRHSSFSRSSSHSRRRPKTKYHIYVDYTVGRTEYTTSFTLSRSKFSEGEKVTVMYDPNDPENCYVVGAFKNGGITISVSGIIFLVISIAFIIEERKKSESE